MKWQFCTLPFRTIGIAVAAFALAVAFVGCSTESDRTSSPVASLIDDPQFFVGTQDQLDITVTSDKELYEVEETAHFTVVVHKNGQLWGSDNTVVDASFPDESTPVSLTHVSLGTYSYDTTLPSEGQKTLTVSATHDYASAIAAMEVTIVQLVEEIADLENQLAAETDPNKRRVLQTKIDNRLSMIDKFEDKISNMEEPMAIGMKTITVESPEPPISLTWFNCMNGASFTGNSLPSNTLGEEKLAALAPLGIPPSDAHLYRVGTRPGSPLDETKTLTELGITNGTALYLWK